MSKRRRKVTFDTFWGKVSFYAPVTETNRQSLYKKLKPLFKQEDVKRKPTSIEWIYDGDCPDSCGADGCRESINGLWNAKIKVGEAEFWITACQKCMKRAMK